MIEVRGLTKRYESKVAVNALTFDVRPRVVTGFLGPNGSGKSTTLRLILGLDRPDSGYSTIGGRPYRDLRWPLREVGAMLEARASCRPGSAPGSATERPCHLVQCDHLDQLRPRLLAVISSSVTAAWRPSGRVARRGG